MAADVRKVKVIRIQVPVPRADRDRLTRIMKQRRLTAVGACAAQLIGERLDELERAQRAAG